MSDEIKERKNERTKNEDKEVEFTLNVCKSTRRQVSSTCGCPALGVLKTYGTAELDLWTIGVGDKHVSMGRALTTTKTTIIIKTIIIIIICPREHGVKPISVILI